MSIYKALSEFHKEVGKVKKDKKNEYFKGAKYADINAVLDTIREPLEKAKLCFVQVPQKEGLMTKISMIEGEGSIESFVPYLLAKQDMQALGSAITYARRYALVSMLGLEAEDDDGNDASKLPPKPEPKPQVKEQVRKQETLGQYLTDNGLSADEAKSFVSYHKINATTAPKYLADKDNLDRLIKEHIERTDAIL